MDIDECKAWVGCLACYNDGRLIGDWIDVEDLEDWKIPDGHDKKYALDGCPHEEWVTFDTDGISSGEVAPGQFYEKWLSYKEACDSTGMDLDTVVAIVDNGIVTEPGEIEDAGPFTLFENESDYEIAIHLANEYGIYEQIDHTLINYFDEQHWMRDTFSIYRISGGTLVTA